MIGAGDICEVIMGLGRGKSPNLGIQVLVVNHQGEHSVHGPVVRCTGDGIQQLTDAGNYQKTGWADFPVKWLKKIDPISPPGAHSTTKDKEVTT